jgi:hypothetical protein
MNPELERIYESIPEDKPRSRLEPYRELILRWRRQGRTYHRIRQLLADQFNVQVAYAVLYRFIQTRFRPRKVQPEAQLQPEAAQTEQPVAPTITKLSLDEVAQQRALIQELRNTPVVVSEVRKRFVYDPDEPLILEKHKQES